ncbi:MAG: hypothetical protein GY751_24015 [Bacteroidetes bacterium]|nr:hypothetical protein [Bacteroidota bacterium]
MRILVYIILFMLGYRVLKKFFAPNFGNLDQDKGKRSRNNTTIYSTDDEEKSSEIEDVDYEEID